MPWSTSNYPASMRHLSAQVRAKAVEITNALLADGKDDGTAIRIGTAQAEQWAARRRIPMRDGEEDD